MSFGCNDRIDEFLIISDLAQKLGEAVFHLIKEVRGYTRTDGITDENITSYREYLAEVFAELKRMLVDQGDGRLKKGQERVIPVSVPQRLLEVWSADIDENMGTLDFIIARLRDPNYRLQIEDMRFAKAILKVISGM